MIRVDEPTGISASEDSDLGSLATPVQATSYKYDVFGKMVEVTQGVQKRWFKYDALGRLLRVRQPEQERNPNLDLSDSYNTSGHWTAGFTYDVLGNVITATDANGTAITNTYDKAARVTSRTYNDGTPQVTFVYDGIHLNNQPFAKGKLTKVTSSISETQYTKFDNFGRVTESQQKTPFDTELVADATARISKYTYNFAGALVEEEYPSGRKVTNEFEVDGDLAKVTSKKNSTSVNAPFVSNFSYTASGGISQMKLGNGRWETAKFNNRMQVTELGLGASVSDTGTWKTQYEYGELQSNGTVDTAKNTGNIAKQTLSFNGITHPLVQSYKYDALYRIKEAMETANSVANWFQVWGYDRYGNRTSFTQNIGGNPASVNPTIDVNTNRFNASQGFAYDKNGNVTSNVDPITSLNRTFLFNGDNKQYEVKDANGTTTARYYYDGEGKRVKKKNEVTGETTIFVYSSGKLVSEYSAVTPPTNPTVNYTTTDHLGSPRVITDSIGQVTSRRDFLPFGEEVTINVGARSPALKYGESDDKIRQKFTGYQKDTETSLDFAEARMYDNRFGRFTAVDPLLVSGKSANPQTFNRFVYVGNSPLMITDPLGLDWYFNKELGKVDWSYDGKTFHYSKLEVGAGWERMTTLLYPAINGQGRFVSLDLFSHKFEYISELQVLEGLTNGITLGRMAGINSYSPGPGGELVRTLTAPVRTVEELLGHPEVVKFLNDPAVRAITFALGPIATEANMAKGFQASRQAPGLQAMSSAEVDAAKSLPAAQKPGVVGVAQASSGEIVTGTSIKGFPPNSYPPNLTESVRRVYERVPQTSRGPGHGRCVEGQIISSMQRMGIDPSGAVFSVRTVSSGRAIPPCGSCRALQREYDLLFLVDQ